MSNGVIASEREQELSLSDGMEGERLTGRGLQRLLEWPRREAVRPDLGPELTRLSYGRPPGQKAPPPPGRQNW